MLLDPLNARPCPVCFSTQAEPLFRLREDRFGEEWEGELVECINCGCNFLQHPPGAEEVSGFYQRCYGHYEELLAPGKVDYKWVLDRLGLKGLLHMGEPSLVSTRGIQGPRVLDFGCHDGTLLRALEKRGLDVFGYEPHPTPDMQHAKVITGSLDDLAVKVQSLDDIVLSHVLEHLLDPMETLKKLAGLLNPGGRIHIRVPNLNSPWRRLVGKAWIHWHPPFHLQHFAIQHLDLMAAELGLERVEARQATPTDWLVGNLRAWKLQKPPLPNKRFHRPYPTEIYIAARMLNLLVEPLWGGDLLETIYRLPEPSHGR